MFRILTLTLRVEHEMSPDVVEDYKWEVVKALLAAAQRQAAIMDPALSILPDTIQMEWDNVQR